MSTSPLQSTPYQREAIAETAKKLHANKGVLLHGRTGSGKTIVAIGAITHLAALTKKDEQSVIIICPAMQGELPQQWARELVRCGVPRAEIVVFRGAGAKVPSAARWVIATPDQVLAERKRGDDRAGLFCVRYDVLCIDEVHNLRNGTPLADPENVIDVDEAKKKFATLMRLVAPHVLALSATPMVNRRLDLYSLVVMLGLADKFKKAAFRSGALKQEWKAQKKLLCEQHIVSVAVPPEVAGDDRVVIEECACTMSTYEREGASEVYPMLLRRIRALLLMRSDSHTDGGRDSERRARERRLFKLTMEGFTRARRGSSHPVFFAPPERDPTTQAPLPTANAAFTRFPLTDVSSKFEAVVKIVRDAAEERVLVLAFFARPLDFLAQKLQVALSADDDGVNRRQVVVHHSQLGRPKCTAAMRDFREIENAVMLATFGSIGEGVDLAMTTHDGARAVRLVCMDAPLSPAQEQQMRGRIRRPLAQPHVTRWYVHQLVSKHETLPTIDDAVRKIVDARELDAQSALTTREENDELGNDKSSSVVDVRVFDHIARVCEAWSNNAAGREASEREQQTREGKEHLEQRVRDQPKRKLQHTTTAQASEKRAKKNDD